MSKSQNRYAVDPVTVKSFDRPQLCDHFQVSDVFAHDEIHTQQKDEALSTDMGVNMAAMADLR